MRPEWLPRQPETAAGQINAEENRMSWMLVGTVRLQLLQIRFARLIGSLLAQAVRLGYMMGLDSKTLTPAQPFDPNAEHPESEEILNRERVAWTCERELCAHPFALADRFPSPRLLHVR